MEHSSNSKAFRGYANIVDDSKHPSDKTLIVGSSQQRMDDSGKMLPTEQTTGQGFSINNDGSQYTSQQAAAPKEFPPKHKILQNVLDESRYQAYNDRGSPTVKPKFTEVDLANAAQLKAIES
mmetsp:Transcript_38735/g.58911  ORF Transcript_38735/g.58911 Transcript_38735/m.58911 type:complete len:122 (-) Transcript_38735:74-439(-)